MKKKILLISAIIVCVAIAATGTLAYFTAEDTAQNVITAGGIDVNVLVNGESNTDTARPIPIMPGTTVDHIVSVENVEQTAWIRVNYTVTVLDASGKQMELSPEDLAKVVIIEPNGENWTQKDGWWYYNTAVETDSETSPLFESIAFSATGMGNGYQKCSVVIDITAHAVQYANNGGSVLEAAGWPAAE